MLHTGLFGLFHNIFLHNPISDPLLSIHRSFMKLKTSMLICLFILFTDWSLCPVLNQNELLKLWMSLDTLLGHFRREIGLTQGLYWHRNAQHRKTQTDMHACSGIRIYEPSVQRSKILRTPDSVAAGTGQTWMLYKVTDRCPWKSVWTHDNVYLLILVLLYILCTNYVKWAHSSEIVFTVTYNSGDNF